MAGYTPLQISAFETGLVQSRQNFLLPNDAYPVLENAFVWRERIKRKQGYETLGRLRRLFVAQSLGNTGASPWTFILYTFITTSALETNKEIQKGSVVITIQAGPDIVFTDQGNGTLTSPTGGNSGTINYTTGSVTLTHTAGAGIPAIASFNYYPSLPVMGLRQRELNNINNEMLIAFDQVYAYRFTAAWQEFITGTTWTGNDSDFFWSTNYWVGDNNLKIFWVTNNTGATGDPIRYTNGTSWINFAPTINAAGDVLFQCLAMLPFRGRMLVFNTFEGPVGTYTNYRQRIRWAAIGNPFAIASAIVTTVSADAWRDDIRGKGGFLDIPTSDNIVSVGFVRDNLVIYCESSTWQLRYTGRSIAPFQIEKVNTELGAESTFSAVQFDTSLVGVGDKGIVECDSFKSDRIDVKIPDLVFQFNNDNNGTKRVHGIRDFVLKLAYWTYPLASNNGKFPDRRLVYNYENDSWAIFTDSLTTLGTFQPQSSRTWATTTIPWSECNFPWVDRPALIPDIVGGNQQGFVLYLDSKVTNDPSLTINNITGNVITPTRITSYNHNLQSGQVIKITGIPTGTSFATSLNNKIFSIAKVDADNFLLYVYDPLTKIFSKIQADPVGTYIGGGQISIRDNFSIVSKKFNYMDDGQNIQMGYVDILMDSTAEGEISLNAYLNYNDTEPANTLFQNSSDDTFFNQTVPTSISTLGGIVGSKNWQRVFCPIRGNFITLEWTLSNEQLTTSAQESDVQIDAQVIWTRKAGRLTQI